MNKVSIIIPVYNAERFIKSAIESALAQDWMNKEIIIVDDGSIDSSLSIAKSYESDFVKIVSIVNSGQCTATNIGLSLSSGDFIQYLDADDLLDPKKISSQMLALDGRYDCVAVGSWARFSDDINAANFVMDDLWRSTTSLDWIRCMWNTGGMMANNAYLIPKSIANAAGAYNENLTYNNDFEYFTRIILASKEVVFCGEAKSYYRSGIGSSLSKRRTYEAAYSEYMAKSLSIRHILKYSTDSLTKDSCASAMYSFLYSLNDEYEDLFQLGVKEIKSLGVNKININQWKLSFLSNILGWNNALWLKKRLYKRLIKLIDVFFV